MNDAADEDDEEEEEEDDGMCPSIDSSKVRTYEPITEKWVLDTLWSEGSPKGGCGLQLGEVGSSAQRGRKLSLRIHCILLLSPLT